MNGKNRQGKNERSRKERLVERRLRDKREESRRDAASRDGEEPYESDDGSRKRLVSFFGVGCRHNDPQPEGEDRRREHGDREEPRETAVGRRMEDENQNQPCRGSKDACGCLTQSYVRHAPQRTLRFPRLLLSRSVLPAADDRFRRTPRRFIKKPPVGEGLALPALRILGVSTTEGTISRRLRG